MDTSNHVIGGGIFGYTLAIIGINIAKYLNILPEGYDGETIAYASAIVNGIAGTLPDVPAELSGWNEWGTKWYDKAHRFGYWFLNIIPGSLLHIILDRLGHGQDRYGNWQRWYANESNWDYFLPWKWREAMWLESTTWMGNIILLTVIIWKIGIF